MRRYSSPSIPLFLVFFAMSGGCGRAGALLGSDDPDPTPTPTNVPPGMFLVSVDNVPGGISVVSEPAGINCPGTCSAAFDEGASIQLHLKEPQDHHYCREYVWNGCDASNQSSCAVIVSGDRAVDLLGRNGAGVDWATMLGDSGMTYRGRDAAISGAEVGLVGEFGTALSNEFNGFLARLDLQSGMLIEDPVPVTGEFQRSILALAAAPSSNHFYLGGRMQADTTFGADPDAPVLDDFGGAANWFAAPFDATNTKFGVPMGPSSRDDGNDEVTSLAVDDRSNAYALIGDADGNRTDWTIRRIGVSSAEAPLVRIHRERGAGAFPSTDTLLAREEDLLIAGSADIVQESVDESGDPVLRDLNNSGMVITRVSASLGTEGEILSSTTFDGAGRDYLEELISTDSGEFFLGGSFEDAISLGALDLTATADRDGVVSKLDSGLVPQWAVQFGGSGRQSVRSVAADKHGNVWALVEFTDELIVEINSVDVLNYSGIAFTSVAVVQVDAAGDQVLFAERISSRVSADVTLARKIVVGSDDRPIVLAEVTGQLDLGTSNCDFARVATPRVVAFRVDPALAATLP